MELRGKRFVRGVQFSTIWFAFPWRTHHTAFSWTWLCGDGETGEGRQRCQASSFKFYRAGDILWQL